MANYMVEQLAILYGEPKTPNPKAFLNAYVNALANNDHETLVDATDMLVRQRKISAWPTIGECLDAVKDAKNQAKSKGFGLEPIDNWDQWYGGLLAQIEHATNESQIDSAIAKIAPYAKALWCFPHRLTDAQKLGEKRRTELRYDNARNPAGADA